MDLIFKLENQGWVNLTTQIDVARDYADTILREDAVMVLPDGRVLNGKSSILSTIPDQQWDSYNILNYRIISLTEKSKVMVYKVTANREGREPYEALISSTYVESDGNWRLAHHQQTPVSVAR